MSNILSLYPVRLHEYEVVNDIVVVLFIDPKPSFIEKIFFKKLSKTPSKLDLDEIGSFIWLLCDGKLSVEEIIQKGRENFGEKIEPAENRVETFFKNLYAQKLIELYQKVKNETK